MGQRLKALFNKYKLNKDISLALQPMGQSHQYVWKKNISQLKILNLGPLRLN